MPFPLLTAAAPAIGAIGASLLGGMFGSKGASQANAASQRSQDIAWDRELYASNTAYQRATADMKAAGLNPMLAYSQGGASAPSTSGVMMQNTQQPMALAMAGVAQTLAEAQLKKSQVDLNQSSAGATHALELKTDAERGKIGQEINHLGQMIKESEERTSGQKIQNRISEIAERVQGLDEESKRIVLSNLAEFQKQLLRQEKAKGDIAGKVSGLFDKYDQSVKPGGILERIGVGLGSGAYDFKEWTSGQIDELKDAIGDLMYRIYTGKTR